MLRSLTLSLFAIAATVMAAGAADLPAQSRLGAVFAEPAVAEQAYAYRANDYWTVYAPEINLPPLVSGYYGKPSSYFRSSYYGSDWVGNYMGPHSRLPYACGFYGYC